MIDKKEIKFVPLNQLLKEYSEKNIDNIYPPVAVGKYGIRRREDIYKKELAKDYSKNKIIYKNTLTIGMGSNQIDIGILDEDVRFSVSPAYHTFKISNVNNIYLDYCLQNRNNEMFNLFVKKSARQGKNIDIKKWLEYKIPVYDSKSQKEIENIISIIKDLIKDNEMLINNYNELIKARFVEMFGDINNATRFDRKQWNELVTIVNGKDHKKVSGSGNYGVYGTGGRMLDCTEYMVDKNTIIMGRKGTIDRPYICPEKAWIVDTAFGVNPKDERVNYMYLYWYTKNIDYNKLNKAAVLPSTTKSDLLQLWMNVPPIELQNEFAQFVEQIDKSKFTFLHVCCQNIKHQSG